jgi:hypothetical protein
LAAVGLAFVAEVFFAAVVFCFALLAIVVLLLV